MPIAANAVLLLLLSLVIAPSFEMAKAADKESETIIRLERVANSIRERRCGDRRSDGNSDFYWPCDSSGQVTKIEQLKLMEKREKRDLGVTYTARRQDIRFFGNVALLTGLTEVKIASNEPAEQALVTEIWVKQDGTWKIEHLQEGTLTPPQ